MDRPISRLRPGPDDMTVSPQHSNEKAQVPTMPGLLRGVARTAVVAGTATAVSNRVSRRQGERWARRSAQTAPRAYAAAPPVQNPEPPAPVEQGAATDDRIAALTKLGELRSSGVLTETEFEAEKRRILGL